MICAYLVIRRVFILPPDQHPYATAITPVCCACFSNPLERAIMMVKLSAVSATTTKHRNEHKIDGKAKQNKGKYSFQ